MKEQKNIDRLFQEKFKHFEVHPSDKVWSQIIETQKKEKIIPLWWKFGGIAASLIILLTIGGLLLNNGETVNNNIVNQEPVEEQSNQDFKILSPSNKNEETSQETISEIVETNASIKTTEEKNTILQNNTKNITPVYTVNSTSGLVKQNQKNSNNLLTSNSGETYSVDNNQNKKVQETGSNNAIAYNDSSQDSGKNSQNKKVQEAGSNNAIAYNDPSQDSGRNVIKQNTTNHSVLNANDSEKNNTTIVDNIDNSEGTSVASSEVDSKKDLTVEAEKIEALKNEEEAIAQTDLNKNSKWNVGAIAAPVYYGDFGGSGVDSEFSDNSKTGDVNLSYGVQISYEVSPKLKIRTGVSTVDLSYTTNGISFSTSRSAQTSSLNSINFANDVERLIIVDEVPQEFVSSLAQERSVFLENGALEQQFNYIEVPMEAVYSISDKRVGFSVIGGISTLFLNDNKVLLVSDEVTTTLGSSNAVNDVSFSTNIGIGIDYKMTDKLQLNVEPSFKYQINGFDADAVEFNPYYLGVYTGISYKF